MTEKSILFGRFEFPRLRDLEYLLDEEKPKTDYLFVNEPNDGFSMYFENGFPAFTVPPETERSYCLFESKQTDRTIRFFCPEKRKNLDSVVWYFYLEVFDSQGTPHRLPGQIRVNLDRPPMTDKPRFVEVLESVRLLEESDLAQQRFYKEKWP